MNRAILDAEVQKFIANHLHESPSSIALKRSPFAEVSPQELAEQIDSKVRTEKKLPLWFSTPGIYYPPKLSVEQASSETTARYKSTLISGNRIIDLTGGFGVDSHYFSLNANVTHVERNENLTAIARHNAKALEAKNIRFFSTDSIGYLKHTDEYFDTIYIDPSRRVKAQKVFRLSDCEPDVVSNLPLLLAKSARILIKTAPLLDIQQGLKELSNVSQIHVVSIRNDCKELLWVIDRQFAGEPLVICTSLNSTDQRYSFKLSEEHDLKIQQYAHPQRYVYEPDVALLKAGCFKLITRDFGVQKLNPNSHLYTSAELNSDFIGRKFELIQMWDYKSFRLNRPLSRANVICRNFPLSPEEIKKKTKLLDGGNEYLLFTTGPDDKLLTLHCKRL